MLTESGATGSGAVRLRCVALSISFGSGWRYLVEHAEEGVSERDRGRQDNYYLRAADHGEPPGMWMGRGIELLGLQGEVKRHDMEAVFGRLEHPVTGEALGAPPRNYATTEERLAKLLAKEPEATPERRDAIGLEARKSTREARLYADMTFSPPKSWSVLHASLERVGRHDEADAVWQSWLSGVNASLDYLQREAGYSRAGYHGSVVGGRSSGRWVDAHDWVMSGWRHHTSRDGDPQLHIHVAVLNRVMCEDGTWRTLDSKAITRVRPAAEALAHRVAEQQLGRSLGVSFETRPDGAAREVVGIDARARDLFSSRRRAISDYVTELASAYEERHGVAPKAYQLTLMAEHATLKTRARKLAHPPTREALLDEWEAKSVDRLGTTLEEVLDGVEMDMEKPGSSVVDFDQVISQALAEVDRSKAVWSRYDLVAQIDHYLPDSLRGLDPRATETLLTELTDRALAPNGETVCLTAPELVVTPQELRRADGCSIYEPYGAQRYATTAQLTREERLVAMAHTSGGRRLDADRVEALLASSSLGPDQHEAVRDILCSDRRIEVLVGPAGTGKSYAMGQLSEVWEREGGKVVGVAVAESAAQVLRGEGIDRAANLTRFLKIQDAIAQGRATRAERRDYTLTDKSLIVLDEASMMPTAELSRVVALAHGAGAKVLITGDDRQLEAVGAGGAMALLIKEVGAHELREVRRFDSEWEGPASLKLRAGDTEALAEYDRHGRFVDGTREAVTKAAYRGFMADHLEGKAALLIVSSNEQAAELSSQVRQDLVSIGRVEERGVRLHNNTMAGCGDLIQTRRNDRLTVDANGRHVVNRDVYVVTQRLGKDALKVRRVLDSRTDLGPELTLSGAYVREHVELAYAVTTHAAQGRTVTAAHLVADEGTNRAGLYVGVTRGREANTVYVVTEHPAEEFNEEVKVDRLAVLSSIVERSESEQSATEVMREELDASESLARLGPIWADCVAEEARQRYDAVLVEVLGADRAAQVRNDDAAGPLFRLVRNAEVDGHDPRDLLTRTVSERELKTADSLAEVLHYRLTKDLEHQEARSASEKPRRPQVLFMDRTPEPEGLEPPGLVDTTTRAAYARQLALAMDQRQEELGNRAVQEQPAWAHDLGPVPNEPLQREEWANRAAAVAAYREQYGFDSPTEAIGVAPRGGDPDRRVAWDQAWSALGRPQENRDVARLTDGELQNHVVAYEREEAWAPLHPGDQLRQAHERARYWSQKATLERAGLSTEDHENTPGVPQPAADDQHSSAEQIAAQMRAHAAQLDEVAAARSAWHSHTQDKQELARRAGEELERRHPKPNQEAAPEAPIEVAGRAAVDHQQADLSRADAIAAALQQARAARQIIDDRTGVAERAAYERSDYIHLETQKVQHVQEGIEHGL